MADDYDALIGDLKKRGLLDRPKDSGDSPTESADEDKDPWWKRTGKGFAKGAAGQAVGAGEAIAGLTGGDPKTIPGEEWVNEPSRSKWESVGYGAGAILPWTLPFLMMPEIGAASALARILGGVNRARIASSAAEGALIGGAQPTGGDPGQHIGGALAGGIGGGATAIPGFIRSGASALAHKFSPGAGVVVHSMIPGDLGSMARAAAAIKGANIQDPRPSGVQWPVQLPTEGLPSRPSVQGASGPAGRMANPPSGDANNPFGITEEDVADPPM